MLLLAVGPVPMPTSTRFNWAHRKLYNRLLQLGAQPICDRGEADEQHPEGCVFIARLACV